jgi:Ni/Fe-hydrogenase subunit HybB-like protein
MAFDEGSGRMPQPVKPKRWGIRALAFLGLAAGSIMLSNWMRFTGNDDYILLPFLGLVAGLIGATVASLRGLRAWGGKLPRG